MTLEGTVWHKANLRSVSIISLNSLDTDFSGSDLKKARFSQTYMNNTNFSDADLSGAVFDTSALKNTDFKGANLSGATFNTSAIENADFSGANLQGIKYDSIALNFFAGSKLDGARMSADLQKDLENLRSGKTT